MLVAIGNMPDYWYSKRFGNAEVFASDTQVWMGLCELHEIEDP